LGGSHYASFSPGKPRTQVEEALEAMDMEVVFVQPELQDRVSGFKGRIIDFDGEEFTKLAAWECCAAEGP